MMKVLIVEDEVVIRSALKRLLIKHLYEVDEAQSVPEAIEHLKSHHYHLVISDLRLPGESGTALIKIVKSTPVLIMTSYASMRSAIEAIKLGAADYIAKPFDHDEMLAVIKKLTSMHSTFLSQPSSAQPSEDLLCGSCEAIIDLKKRICKIAQTDATVLILGESGTGKELAAKSIHQSSQRASAPLISVNCAAIPESLIESELFGHEKGAFTGADTSRNGLIEAADGGTLFLDEIGELPIEAQARLLRFLQENEIRKVGAVHAKKVDVRLIAATHRNLSALVEQGLFRQDLYYRLYVMELTMPPLRERGRDILVLAHLFLKEQCDRYRKKIKFSQATEASLLQHVWPGNVRELKNAIERAVILVENTTIEPDLLGLGKPVLHSDATLDTATIPHDGVLHHAHATKQDQSLDDYFVNFVKENQNNMNETELAKKLGISRKGLWEKRQRFGIPRKSKSNSSDS